MAVLWGSFERWSTNLMKFLARLFHNDMQNIVHLYMTPQTTNFPKSTNFSVALKSDKSIRSANAYTLHA